MPELVFKTAPVVAPADKVKGPTVLSAAALKHVEMVQAMKDNNTTATIELPHKTDEEKAIVRFLIADVQAAARSIGITARKAVTELTGNKAGKVSVTFTPKPGIKQTKRPVV